MRKTKDLADDWLFHKGKILSLVGRYLTYFRKSLPKKLKEDSQYKWQNVRIPHDWDIRGPFLKSHASGTSGGFAPCGVGWYKKNLEISETMKGKKIFLRFDGIYKRATLYLNGEKIKYHYYGYGPFEVDITDNVQYGGKNTLYVLVNNSIQPSCRWYSGSGIYREVTLVSTDKVYIPWGGLFVYTPNVRENEANVEFTVEINNESGKDVGIVAEFEIEDPSGNIVHRISQNVALRKTMSGDLDSDIQKKNPNMLRKSFKLTSPSKWGVKSPKLYTLHAKLMDQEGNVLDNYSERFGVRSYEFNGTGFYLNGKKLTLKGVCLHHDGGCVGAAVPKEVWRQRFQQLKSMGCNSIRTSHNVPAANFVELCDEMGILLIDEAFDKWTLRPRLGAWGGRQFKRDWKQELFHFVRRDRNHPSVILWSLGNEVNMIHKKSVKKYQMPLYNFVKGLDPTRPITTTLSPNNTKHELKNVEKGKAPYIHDMVDVFCTNYMEKRLPDIHKLIPDKAIIIAEAHHWYRNKLESETDLPTSRLHPDCTDRNPWYDVEENEFCVGQYLWVGIEYLGEVRDPYPYHGRTNAPIRINGLKKPQAAFHSSVWLDKPFVQLAVKDETADIPRGKPQFDFPKIVCHWNFSHLKEKATSCEVWTFSNCDSVELILNGESLGEKNAEDYPYNRMTWDVDFQPGTLKAIGKIGGEEVSESVLNTSKGAKKIVLRPHKKNAKADGKDCVHLEVNLVDEDGELDPFADNEIKFDVDGAGRLLGIDSGDLSDFTEEGAYQSEICDAYWGRAVGIIQTTKSPGEIKITVRDTQDRLEAANLIVESQKI